MSIKGAWRYLWRAVDQRGITLGVPVTRRRDAQAARRLLRKLLVAEQYVPGAGHRQAALLPGALTDRHRTWNQITTELLATPVTAAA